MYLEKIETINQRLDDHFGHDDLNRPIWRVSWSSDQIEKQLLREYHGVSFATPQLIEVKKYPFNQDRYVLERLVLVPDREIEMVVRFSYEPMWFFEDANGFPLPPKWEACKHIIDCVYLAMGKLGSGPRYKDPDSGLDAKQLVEKEAVRIKEIQEDLFGNETDVTDALAVKEGISVPHNYEKRNN